MKQLLITQEVIDFIKERKCDFRVCTHCGGPVMLPVPGATPKPNDVKVQVGDHTLYISATQVRYLDVIDSSILATNLY